MTKLADVRKYVPNLEQARLLFSWMKEQRGLLLCAPPQPKCETCEERFECYTGGGKIEELVRLISTDGWFDEDSEEEEEVGTAIIEQAQMFFEKNKGRVAYIFRIADWGGGARSEAESSMRRGEVFDGVVPYDAWC